MLSPEGPRALFIYYSVCPSRVALALDAIGAVQRALMAADPALCARLWQRAEGDGQPGSDQTWMEVYEHPEGVDAQREAWIQAHLDKLPVDLTGKRHIEAFALVAPLRSPTSLGGG